MVDFFIKFNIAKVNLFKGCLRLSLLTSLLTFLWVALIEAPKHTSIAFGISDQDARDLRKRAHILKDGHEFTYKEGDEYENGKKIDNIYKIKELDESYITDEEKNEVIQKYVDYWNRYGSHRNYICSVKYSCDRVIDRALDRIVKNETLIDYSGGYLVSNKNYGIKHASSTFAVDGDQYISAYYSPDGFSIVPSTDQKIIWCSKTAALDAFLAFVCTSLFLPLFCYVLYFSILIPILLIRTLRSYIHWVKNGFI